MSPNQTAPFIMRSGGTSFAFSACGRKFKPHALRVVVDQIFFLKVEKVSKRCASIVPG